MSHTPSDKEIRIAHYIVAAGIAVSAIAPALPDTVTGSPRSIATAAGIALIGVGVYLGAAKPDPSD